MSEHLDFYAGRRVFVTGHTGFKGSWLTAWLRLLGAHVTGYALPPEGAPSLFADARIGEGVTSILGDICDEERLARAMAEARPEIVLHLAAQALVRRSYARPLETFATNVLGTARVLEAARRLPSVRVVVVVTTDKCYENHEWVWGYRETDALGGHDTYSASKACAELVASAYRRSFYGREVALATARAGNVIGGGDWAEDRIVPDIVRSVAAGEPARIRHPRAVRPWQHVLDPLSGYLLLARRLWDDPAGYSGAWNFGPDDAEPTTVHRLAEAIVRALGRGSLDLAEPSDGERLHEAGALRLDCSKARSRLGWRPLLDTDRAIQLTSAWYARYLEDRGRARSLVDEQLRFAAGLA
ncbi:CDP-glucose 4,6-dehydratase [Sorangium sp. So ce542]|uniref:CDP-glucose 4,6-dehydratase n=1 Tax=Sorangium sp. So ce542 TaxID=3133316 RepID=UPI003F5F1471